MSDNPFHKFVSNMLEEFKKHLSTEGMTENTITGRMMGATEFAKFLVGDPHSKHERTKGTI